MVSLAHIQIQCLLSFAPLFLFSSRSLVFSQNVLVGLVLVSMILLVTDSQNYKFCARSYVFYSINKCQQKEAAAYHFIAELGIMCPVKIMTDINKYPMRVRGSKCLL